MALWSATAVVDGLTAGVPITVFNGETLSDGEESIAVALPARKHPIDLTWTIVFGATPAVVNYRLQVALNNVDAEFYDLGTTITSTAGGKVTASNVVARFARLKAADSDVQTVTGQIMVN